MTTTATEQYEGVGMHLCAPNDRNGNPRRVYIVFPKDGDPQSFDEGYVGDNAVPQHIFEQVDFYRVNVSATEYRNWLRDNS